MPARSQLQQHLKTFGENVRRERVAVDMSQERLSELVDINIRSLQRIEAGQMNILMTTVVRIKHALRCPWGALMPDE